MNLPRMSLHIGDYRRDTAHLDAGLHGAYLLLIMHYWSTGSLPDDDRQLSRISCMAAGEWKRARPVLQAFFRDGWKHKRIDDELIDAQARYERRVAAGRKGGRPAKDTQDESNAKAKLSQSLNNAEATLTLTPTIKEQGEATRASPRAMALQLTPEFQEFWTVYPNKVGKEAALLSFIKARQKRQIPFEIIMGALRRYVAKTDDRPWCNPTTWLNQGRWEDQPATVGGPAPIVRDLVQIHEGTEEMDAWDRHWRKTKGVNAPRSKHGGIFVETQWPPGGEHERGADREIAPQQAILRAGSGSFTSG